MAALFALKGGVLCLTIRTVRGIMVNVKVLFRCSGTFTKRRTAKTRRRVFAFEEKLECAAASCLALFLPFMRNPFRDGLVKSTHPQKSISKIIL